MLLRTRAEAKFRKARGCCHSLPKFGSWYCRTPNECSRSGGVTGRDEPGLLNWSSGSARGHRGNKEMERSWFSWDGCVIVGLEVVCP